MEFVQQQSKYHRVLPQRSSRHGQDIGLRGWLQFGREFAQDRWASPEALACPFDFYASATPKSQNLAEKFDRSAIYVERVND